MTPTIKAGLLATTMAAMALVPAAGVVTLATADAAHAKGEGNGNGGGGGNGNGNGGGGERGNGGSEARGGQSEARGGGRPEWAGGQRNGGENGNRGGGRSENARGGSDPISDFIRKLSGEEKREARTQARADSRPARQAPTEYAPEVSIAPVKRPSRSSDMHPSELGNMNGALNANMNAVLAHIRNGNTSGPVGQMAALAVASAAATDAREVLSSPDAEGYAEFQSILEDQGFDSLEAYRASEEENEAIEEALAGFDGFDETRYRQYREAGEAEADLLAAQESILAFWNKNPDAEPGIDEELEQPLLDSLMSRFTGREAEIERAIADAEARAASGDLDEDEEAACADIDGCEAPDAIGEEEVAAAD